VELLFYYYITDRLGNVRYVLNSSGSVVQSYLYSPFGEIHSSSGSLTQPYQYVGGEFYYTEGDIGLKLLGQRWYDSGVGRFISRDPVFSVTLYSYVQNEPVDEVDPEGLKKKEKKQKSGWNITKVRWYGNWCGPGWSGGEFPLPGKTKWNVSAIDPLDECCKKHDACFQGYDLINHKYLPKEKRKSKEECNKEFCKCLENIDKCELIEAGGVGKLEGMKRFFCK